MPNYYYRTGNGEEVPITLEACVRGLPHCYHAIKKSNGDLITIHRDSVVIKLTEEDILQQERLKVKESLRVLAEQEAKLSVLK